MDHLNQRSNPFRNNIHGGFHHAKNNLAITSNVYLQTLGDQLLIKATDGKVGFSTSITVDVQEEGKALVLQEKLLEILRVLPDGDINFSINDGYFTIVPIGHGIDFKIRMIEADQFPALETVENDRFFSIAQSSFLDMSEQVIFAVSDDTSRYFLCGIYIERSEGGITMVATDGRRLSIVERVFEERLPSFAPIIVLPKFFYILRKIGTGEGRSSLQSPNPSSLARIGGRTFYINLISGTVSELPPGHSRAAKLSMHDEDSRHGRCIAAEWRSLSSRKRNGSSWISVRRRPVDE